MCMMMRLWRSMTGCGTTGTDLGKDITLFAMTGDCTSQPPAAVQPVDRVSSERLLSIAVGRRQALDRSFLRRRAPSSDIG
jgi:hypothetical protein